MGFSPCTRSPVPDHHQVVAQTPQVFNPQPKPKVFNPNSEISESAKAKRHKISLNVVSLEELKIADGDTIAAGDLISDRTEQRLALESQISRIESAIKQLANAPATI